MLRGLLPLINVALALLAVTWTLSGSMWFCCCASFAQDSQAKLAQIRILVNKGNFLLSRNAFQEAINAYEEALKIDPQSKVAQSNIVETYNRWGIFYYAQRKYDEALKEWQQALRLDSGHQNAKRNVALLMQIMRKENKTVTKDASVVPAKLDSSEPSAVVILTPGIKSSGTKSSNVEQEADKPVKVDSSPSSYEAQDVKNAPDLIEDKLCAIETKIYGKKNAGMPILQRLEKVELDTSGHISSGSILERINVLMHTYGLGH